MAAEDYYQEFMNQIMGTMMPGFNQRRNQLMDVLRAQALRTGQPMSQVAMALSPFAEEAGDAAAKAGVSATKMAEQRRQFESDQANWQKQFEESQRQFDEQQKLREQEMQMQKMQWLMGLSGGGGGGGGGYGGGGAGGAGGRGYAWRMANALGIDMPRPFGVTRSGRDVLYERAMMPGPKYGGNYSQQRQQAWLRNLYG